MVLMRSGITLVNAGFKTSTLHAFVGIRNCHSFIPADRLKGKIAIITASTDGIGFAIAKRLAQEGAKIIISSRKEHKVHEAISKLKSERLDVTGLVCHVSRKDDRKLLFDKAEELGGLDILVSNAGVNPVQVPITEYEEETWNKIFNVNVTASFLLAKEAYSLLKKRKGASITFVSSISALQPVGLPIGAYAVSKTALLGLTKILAEELGKDNIRVNCVVPGVIKTHFGKYITGNAKHTEYSLGRTLLKRFGLPEDISGVVAFMVSDDAQFITGENIVAAGGMHSRL